MMNRTWEKISVLQYEMQERPVSVPAAARISRRIAVLLLILQKCRGQTANLELLHAFDWGLSTRRGRCSLERRLEYGEGAFPFRYDPMLDRALAFADAMGLCTTSSEDAGLELGLPSGEFRVKLTPAGEETLSEILLDGAILVEERQTLQAIGRSISMTDAAVLLKGASER